MGWLEWVDAEDDVDDVLFIADLHPVHRQRTVRRHRNRRPRLVACFRVAQQTRQFAGRLWGSRSNWRVISMSIFALIVVKITTAVTTLSTNKVCTSLTSFKLNCKSKEIIVSINIIVEI